MFCFLPQDKIHNSYKDFDKLELHSSQNAT